MDTTYLVAAALHVLLQRKGAIVNPGALGLSTRVGLWALGRDPRLFFFAVGTETFWPLSSSHKVSSLAPFWRREGSSRERETKLGRQINFQASLSKSIKRKLKKKKKPYPVQLNSH